MAREFPCKKGVRIHDRPTLESQTWSPWLYAEYERQQIAGALEVS